MVMMIIINDNDVMAMIHRLCCGSDREWIKMVTIALMMHHTEHDRYIINRKDHDSERSL
jgi:hypothetical protein